MKYLIDTDIASYYLRGKYNLISVFEKKDVQNIRLSRITVAELEVLAYKNPTSQINLSAINAFAQGLGILEVDNETWQIYSKIKAKTLKQGKKRGDIDILIASIAKQYDMTVVTNNISHYEDLAMVENWIVNNK
jgi:tRNA(fMet)-specific endonuclease VapC